MMFINAASTISYQPTFRNKRFSSALTGLHSSSQLISPDYSDFIPSMERRRMSQVQKMSIACAMDCLQQAGLEQPQAIIVGTSMGCSVNTKNFLDKILSAGQGPLSPTSFIVSTHNTVAGQIALLLKNHGYNMTYTQISLSFEQSLIDAMMLTNGGLANVLVGGADEEEDSIYNMRARLKNNDLLLTSGASFFIVSGEKKNESSVQLADVESFGLIEDASEITKSFLHANHILPDEIDLILFAYSEENSLTELKAVFGSENLFDYQKITGTYYTSSAFAMHYAIDILSVKEHTVFGNKVRNILVYNNLIPENLGLILLKSERE
jgi:hypothetical protein